MANEELSEATKLGRRRYSEKGFRIIRGRRVHRPTTPRPAPRETHRPGFGDQPRLLHENAETYMQLAEHAIDGHSFDRYKQLEAAWLALAESADWLEGKIPPVDERLLGK